MNASSTPSWLALALAGAALLSATGCQRSDATPAAAPVAEPPSIPVVRAVPPTTPELVPFTGRIEAAQKVDLRARVSGPITEIHFNEGAIIGAGAPLFTLDPRPYRARRDQAAARLVRAQVAAKLARQELVRARELRASAAIAIEEFDRRAAEADAADAGQHAAAAELAAAELDLNFTVVRAPVAGRVGRALLTIGNHAAADATVLTTIVSVDVLRVRFAVDEPTFHRLRATRAASVGAQLTVAGLPRIFPARIDYLGNAVDPATGTAEVRGIVTGQVDDLADGMFARVELHLPALPASVVVPETALGAAQGSRYVLVADGEGKLAQRAVTLGPRTGPERIVVAGLAPGEAIVTAGLQFLRPGMTIRPLLAAAEKSAPLAAAHP